MALESDKLFGKAPTDLQEREWMEVLRSVSAIVRKQDAIATSCVREYAGPQCYAHRFDNARVRANAPVAATGAEAPSVGDDEAVSELASCWFTCDAPHCRRKRFLSSRAAAALGGVDLLEKACWFGFQY